MQSGDVMKKERDFFQILRWMLIPAIAGVCFLFALTNLEQGQKEEGRVILEEAIRRSCAACYANEGIYPPDLTYLEVNYGIQVDKSRYEVDYRPIGSNLMPDITVLEK